MTSNGDSPVRSIKNVLSLKRQSRDDVSSTNSGSKSPRRNSNDSTMNKLKSIMTHSGNDDAELSDGKRSKSLLGFAKLKEKVRRKSQAVDSQEELRGRDVDPKQTGSDANLSERSSILNDEGSSLLVSEYESEM